MDGENFVLREHQGVPFYACRAFEPLPRLSHGFSTRRGGVPGGGESSLNLGGAAWDSPDRVAENRRRLLSALRLAGAALVTLHQVHSDRVHIIEDIGAQWNRTEGDALVTRMENVALAARTADCIPVLIADPVKRAVAAVHSGWRGTLSGVLPRTVGEMRRAFGSDPSRLLAAIGPGIRKCCYEVGGEVAVRFSREYPGCCTGAAAGRNGGKFMLDLVRVLDAQMHLAGIPPENRFDLDLCTRCHTEEFFSHRAEGAAAGRMMAVIGLLPRRD